MFFIKCFGLLFVLCVIHEVEGHGFMWDPVARGTAFRRGYNTPANYNHMGLNCGGYATQWEQNNGECGVCGDSFSGSRDNEAGGIYAPTNRPITGTYTQGGTLRVEINITAHHRGHFTFRLCPHNDLSTPVSQACLNQHLLYVSSSTTQTKTYITNGTNGQYVINLQLPANLVCSQCVLQWNYTTGNSHRSWFDDVDPCLGCGPQETFINCADIAVLPSEKTTNSSTASATTTVAQSTTMSVLMNSTSTKSITTTSGSTVISTSASNSTAVPLSTSLKTTSSTTSSPTTSIAMPASSTAPTAISASPTTSTSTPTVTTAASETSSVTTTPVVTPTTNATATAPPTSTTTTASSGSQPCSTVTACQNNLSNICFCEVTVVYSAVLGMQDWCDTHCRLETPVCPSTHCTCYCPYAEE